MAEENIDSVPEGVPFSLETWRATPEEVRKFILLLMQRLAALEERVNTNSKNSSAPPSSDPPGSLPNRRQREQEDKGKAKRSRGGQPGHKGHHRSLLPTEQTDSVHSYFPDTCSHCSQPLSQTDVVDAPPVRHQVWDIPPIRPNVTEHQLHRCCCTGCGKTTLAGLPTVVPKGAFGPGLTAVIGVLLGKYRLTRRLCESLLNDGFGLRISLGSISSIEGSISESLAGPVDEVHREIKQAPVVNADDTSWKEDNRTAVIWSANTPELAFFYITSTKDHVSAKELLGEDLQGVLGVDRAKTYSFQNLAKLQSCWAHLDRHFQRMEDRGGDSAPVGLLGKAAVDDFFAEWHEFKDGNLSRAELQTRIVPIRERMKTLLERGIQCGGRGRDKTLHSKTAKTCANILDILLAFFTCCYYDGVEPTNNCSEQALRNPVQWRRTSFGSRCAEGSLFVTRMLTVVETCRRQGRNALEFISQAISAKLRSLPAPSLVPARAG